MTVFDEALAQQEDMVRIRRALHQVPECGMELPLTIGFLEDELTKMGCAHKRVGGGLVAIIGDPGAGPTILLRADMDALSMSEESGLPFASTSDSAHCCGHDLHMTMLLGAARMLKRQEASLKGAVKVVFQPDEEGATGALSMIKAGLLEDPGVDAALALHVNAKEPLGQIDYGMGPTFASNDCFDLLIKGRSGHGARPYEAIDPIKAAAAICGRLDGLTTLHKPLAETAIFTVTSFHGGSNYNVIPNKASLKASMRAYSEETREATLAAMKSICAEIDEWYGVTCSIKNVASAPNMFCSPTFTEKILEVIKKSMPGVTIGKTSTVKVGSEDFAYITQQVPDSAYLFIGAGKNRMQGYEVGQHSSKVVFNEDAIPYGSSVFASYALTYLGVW